MFIEMHCIQNFAPSNLNRDDTNTAKDCYFGGHRRGRISSQCIKRATRALFNNYIDEYEQKTDHGIRTKSILSEVKERLSTLGKEPSTIEGCLIHVISKTFSKFDKKHKDKTKVLLFTGRDEIEFICSGIIEKWNDLLEEEKKSKDAEKKAGKDTVEEKEVKRPVCEGVAEQLVKDFKTRKTNMLDIALFGRMIAEQASLNIDAACQVAHALSTHRIEMEFDFWTAVDDLQSDEEAGAGMMGLASFNSSCFYRYALMDIDQFRANLDENSKKHNSIAAKSFCRAFINAVPTGKQNSFAAYNPPSFVMVVSKIKEPPWSLANAFEKPVSPTHNHSVVENSILQLDHYWGKLVQAYDDGNDNIKSNDGELKKEYRYMTTNDVGLSCLDKQSKVTGLQQILDFIGKKVGDQ